MKKELIKTQMKVKDNLVSVLRVGYVDYISLTDLARYKNSLTPGDVIIKWMSNKSSFDFYCLWEELSNPTFKLAESREFKSDSATQSFTMSPSRWIKETGAIGFVSKRGKYDGGTFAHPDIALEFASWIDSAFKLHLIKDILNVALFGMTAKEWKDKNPTLDGNMRDYANILQLVILVNLENLNAQMIKDGLVQKDRLEKLNTIAKEQYIILHNSNGVEKIEKSDNNHSTKLLN